MIVVGGIVVVSLVIAPAGGGAITSMSSNFTSNKPKICPKIVKIVVKTAVLGAQSPILKEFTSG